ncbi:MAG TPA: isochorismatase family cysteine hydrolase [Capsulimonadaceae bacterium]|nr:isochorismatase family cysteine hydrolase [Capsulimonadaceae bacterium]
MQFFEWLNKWQNERPAERLSEIIAHAGGPQNTAVFCVDMIRGFATEGPLASPRVDALTHNIVKILSAAYEAGVYDLVLAQDSHTANAAEFSAFPPHCIAGTSEAEPIDAIRELIFFDDMTIFPKNCLNALVGTGLAEWLADRPQLNALIVIGDCTDLCVFQLAMGLKMRANSAGLTSRILVPIDCVDTYDLSVDTALSLGVLPHPGDLTHSMALYQMALNGIEILKTIEPDTLSPA